MDELNLIPEALSLFQLVGLIALSSGTSFLTASVGMGGGTVLLAVMAQIIPTKAIIPVHGVVQLGSNFGRAAVMFENIKRQHALWFLGGSLLGALIGGNVVVALPVAWLKLALGGFILYSVWGHKFSSETRSLRGLGIGGALSTLLTMFVGATGPFVVACLRPFGFKPIELVATSAACLVIQHLLKVMVFGFLGFAFSDYIGLIILMIGSGFLGTLLGRKVLLKVNEKYFQYVLSAVLTILAIRLLYSAFMNIYS